MYIIFMLIAYFKLNIINNNTAMVLLYCIKFFLLKLQQVVSDILGEPFVQPQSLNKAHASKKGGHKWQRKALKSPDDTDEIVVEDNGNSDDANDVRQRFKLGCECQDDSCFRGLNPDNVYRLVKTLSHSFFVHNHFN